MIRVRLIAVLALTIAVSAAMLAPALGQEQEWDAPHPDATAAVQVTKDPNPSRAHADPLIDVHPDADALAIIEIEGRTSRDCSVHVSPDRGRRWFTGGEILQDPYTDCAGDPMWNNNVWIKYAQDGTLYAAFVANDPSFRDEGRYSLPRHVFLARSTDSGQTFDTTMVFEAPQEPDEAGTHTNRLPQIAVDPNDSSNVYVSWYQGGVDADTTRALVAASTDGGRTFEDPVNISEGVGSARQPRISVDGDSVLHAVFPVYEDPREVYYRRSAYEAQTWSDPVEMESAAPDPPDDVADDVRLRGNRKWQLEADPSSSRLYFVWYGALDPAATVEESTNNVYVQVSPDGGETWNEPQQVNEAVDANQYHPNVSVAPDGRVDIAWLDFRNSPYPEYEEDGPPYNHGGFQDVYYSYSTDGGETFSPNARISDRSINREIGVWSNGVHMAGHVGLASTTDTAYFTWQDTRNGNEDQQAVDVYQASYLHSPDEGSAAAAGSGAATWLIAGAALILGLGIAMALSAVLVRRARVRVATGA